MIHDTRRGGQDNVAELTSRQQVGRPFLNLGVLDVKTRRDDTTLVDTAIELNDNLTGTVIINNFKFTNIAYNS